MSEVILKVAAKAVIMNAEGKILIAVSYTHLTLPTSDLV